ncbi:hypothetical protein NQ317_014003 [Molorchus minor]|uniref:Major facilitator superfamily (MFS) profile domain-containing protein n=1 Tax=Molorchus minor TaxID=1323400 RepID=A0ABQ9J2H0_9CUCU|nr:hypothetical protein NQ317_014003 [Molorchus minor]
MNPSIDSSYWNATKVKKKNGRNSVQIYAIIAACLATLTNGILFGWSSPFLVKITKDKESYDITEDEASYFTVIPAIAMILSCFLFSGLIDIIGRKRTLLLITLPQLSYWILTALANNVYVFYAARVCSGLCDACAFVALPIYIGEVATPKVRGTFGNFFSLAIFVGILFISVIGNYFSVKVSAYICVTFPVLFAILFSCVPESPYFYVMKGRFEDAKCSLRRFRGKSNVEEEFLQLKSDVERQISELGTWKEVFTIDSNRKAIGIGVFLRASQQLGGGSIFAAYFIIEKVGRKISYVGSLASCSVALLLEAVYFFMDQFHPEINVASVNWIPLAGMLLFVLSASVGMALVPTLMSGELFSASIKAKAVTITVITLGLFQLLVNNLFYWLSINCGFFSSFLLFSVCSGVGSLLSLYFLPETKGKTLEEIQQSLKRT